MTDYDHHLVSEQLRYALTYLGRWLAVATGSAAACHLKARAQFIGWRPEPCRRRRHPKTKATTRRFPKRFRSTRGGRERRHARLHSTVPKSLDL